MAQLASRIARSLLPPAHRAGWAGTLPQLALAPAARFSTAGARPRKRGGGGGTRGHPSSGRSSSGAVDPWRLAELRGRVAELPADFDNPARLAAVSSKVATEWGVGEAPLQAAVQLALVERYADKPCFTPPVMSALLTALSRARLNQRTLAEQVLPDARWALLVDTITRSLRMAPEEWSLRSLATVLYALHRVTPPSPDAAMGSLLGAAGDLLPSLASGRVEYYESVSLVQCLFALSRWRTPHPAVFEALAPIVTRQLEGHTDQGLCMLLQAYGHAQVAAPGLMAAALDVILPRLPGFDQQGVSIVLWALHRQRASVDLTPQARATLHAAALAAVEEGSPSTLTHVSQASAALGLLDGALTRALEQRACSILPEIRGRALSTLALATAGAGGVPSALPGLLLNRVVEDPGLCLDVDFAGVVIAQAVSPAPSATGVLQLLYKLRERGTTRNTDSIVFLAGSLYAMARLDLRTATASAPLADLVLGSRGSGGSSPPPTPPTPLGGDAISSALPREVAFTYQGVFDQVTAMDWHNLQRVPPKARAAAAAAARSSADTHVTISGGELWDALVSRLHTVLLGAQRDALATPGAASPYGAAAPAAPAPAVLDRWDVTANWYAGPTHTPAPGGSGEEDGEEVDWRCVHLPRVLYAIGRASASRGAPSPAEAELVRAAARALPSLGQPLAPPSALVAAWGLAQAGEWDTGAWEALLGQLAPAVELGPAGALHLDAAQTALWGQRPTGTLHSPRKAAEAPRKGSDGEPVTLAAAEVKARRDVFNRWYVDGAWALTASVAKAANVMWAGPQPEVVRKRMQRQVTVARKAAAAAPAQGAPAPAPASQAHNDTAAAAAGVAAPGASHAEQHPIVFGTLPKESDEELLQSLGAALAQSPVAHLVRGALPTDTAAALLAQQST